jgi:hypothetical protein
MYGAYCLESVNMKPFMHSEYAFKMLDSCTIGHLKNIPFYYTLGDNNSTKYIYFFLKKKFDILSYSLDFKLDH